MTFHRVAVVLFDRTPMFESAVPISIFGEDRPGLPRFDVRVVGGDGGREVRTNAGVRVATPYGLDAVAESDLVIVPTYRRPPDEPPPAPALDALRAAYGRGAIVAGLCLGTFVLAAAGLLRDRAAGTHWAYAGLLARLHPDVRVRADDLVLLAQRLLETSDLPIEQVARRSGFASAVALRPHFRRLVGVSPSAYRQSFGWNPSKDG